MPPRCVVCTEGRCWVALRRANSDCLSQPASCSVAVCIGEESLSAVLYSVAAPASQDVSGNRWYHLSG